MSIKLVRAPIYYNGGCRIHRLERRRSLKTAYCNGPIYIYIVFVHKLIPKVSIQYSRRYISKNKIVYVSNESLHVTEYTETITQPLRNYYIVGRTCTVIDCIVFSHTLSNITQYNNSIMLEGKIIWCNVETLRRNNRFVVIYN